jgi:putative ABC transport system ATP-binding protein
MMIELQGVSKIYGAGDHLIPAVSDADLAVAKGGFAVLTGPSGSGKTTLLNLIGGMTRPDRGSIRVDGRDLLALPDRDLSRLRARTIGFVFQHQSLLPTLSALDNVRLPLVFARQKDPDDRARKLLDRVGLGARAQAFARQLSMGQQRRVGIARALINQPRLLICDEPTGDLDPDTEALIMTMIADAHREGATVILATHNHALRSHGTQLLRIEAGELREQ